MVSFLFWRLHALVLIVADHLLSKCVALVCSDVHSIELLLVLVEKASRGDHWPRAFQVVCLRLRIQDSLMRVSCKVNHSSSLIIRVALSPVWDSLCDHG